MLHPCKTKGCFIIIFWLSLISLFIVPLIILPEIIDSNNTQSLYTIQILFGISFYIIMSWTFIKYWKVFPCHINNNPKINNNSETSK